MSWYDQYGGYDGYGGYDDYDDDDAGQGFSTINSFQYINDDDEEDTTSNNTITGKKILETRKTYQQLLEEMREMANAVEEEEKKNEKAGVKEVVDLVVKEEIKTNNQLSLDKFFVFSQTGQMIIKEALYESPEIEADEKHGYIPSFKDSKYFDFMVKKPAFSTATQQKFIDFLQAGYDYISKGNIDASNYQQVRKIEAYIRLAEKIEKTLSPSQLGKWLASYHNLMSQSRKYGVKLKKDLHPYIVEALRATNKSREIKHLPPLKKADFNDKDFATAFDKLVKGESLSISTNTMFGIETHSYNVGSPFKTKAKAKLYYTKMLASGLSKSENEKIQKKVKQREQTYKEELLLSTQKQYREWNARSRALVPVSGVIDYSLGRYYHTMTPAVSVERSGIKIILNKEKAKFAREKLKASSRLKGGKFKLYKARKLAFWVEEQDERKYKKWYKFDKAQSAFEDLFKKIYQDSIDDYLFYKQKSKQRKAKYHERKIEYNRSLKAKFKEKKASYDAKMNQDLKDYEEGLDKEYKKSLEKENIGIGDILRFLAFFQRYSEIYWNSDIFGNKLDNLLSIIKSIPSLYVKPADIISAMNSFYQHRKYYSATGMDFYASRNAWWGGSAEFTLQENYRRWKRRMDVLQMNKQQRRYYADKVPELTALYKADEEQNVLETIGGTTKNFIIPFGTTLLELWMTKKIFGLLFGKKNMARRATKRPSAMSQSTLSSIEADDLLATTIMYNDKVEKYKKQSTKHYKVIITTNNVLLEDYKKVVVV